MLRVEPNWAMKLVHALASPGLATFLLMLGLVGMYIEMKTPGVGVGGVVAALAFLLFFWSKSLEGTATSLEIIMFVGGIVLMLIEIAHQSLRVDRAARGREPAPGPEPKSVVRVP